MVVNFMTIVIRIGFFQKGPKKLINILGCLIELKKIQNTVTEYKFS